MPIDLGRSNALVSLHKPVASTLSIVWCTTGDALEQVMAALRGLHSMSGASSSASGNEAVQPGGDRAASKEQAIGQAMPAPAVSAGPAARSAQVPGMAAGGLRAAGSGGRLRSRGQPGNAAGVPPPLTRATAERLLDVSSTKKAAASLDVVREEAEKAAARSRWVFEHMHLAASLQLRWDTSARELAELLYGRAAVWSAVPESRMNSLTSTARMTLAVLEKVRKAWEERLQAFYGGEDSKARVLSSEVGALAQACASVRASMIDCIETMQKRFTGFVQTAEAQHYWLAATSQVMISLVRVANACSPCCCLWHVGRYSTPETPAQVC